MTIDTRMEGRSKRIALVAHDNRKKDLAEWTRYNRATLIQHELYTMGTTGKLLEQEPNIPVNKLQSSPLGWDPLEPQPHDPDVKALLRIGVAWNIPIACNRASADFAIASPLMFDGHTHSLPDYAEHVKRITEIGGDIILPSEASGMETIAA